MTRAARNAEAAADALLAWLDLQNTAAVETPDAVARPAPASPMAASDGRSRDLALADTPRPQVLADTGAGSITEATLPACNGRENGAAARAPAHTDWLYHHHEIAGPTDALRSFQQAACGAGVIPWHLDLDRLQEDVFLLLVAPPQPQARALGAAGARILAEELRAAVAPAARDRRGARRLQPGLPVRPACAAPRARRDPPPWARSSAGHALAVDALGHHAAAAPCHRIARVPQRHLRRARSWRGAAAAVLLVGGLDAEVCPAGAAGALAGAALADAAALRGNVTDRGDTVPPPVLTTGEPDGWEDPPRRRPATDVLVLSVEGFEGPLEWLLEMVRAHRIDLARLSILALVEAFVTALQAGLAQRDTGSTAPLWRWGDWLVMAANLALLRSRLLLPADVGEATTGTR